MSKDLREILKNKVEENLNLSNNHRINFEARLKNELHQEQKNGFGFWKIAASITILIGLAVSIYFFNTNPVEPKLAKTFDSLGSVSPELKKVENFYLASIQSEILELEQTAENKELLDGYLEKISELDNDYKDLTSDLNTDGINEKIINALIDNLQLRLKLLYQLKEQLNNLKTVNKLKNETNNI
ncbi:hypothetical protein SAMN05444411_11097 [Lutibacter oricola]|uniref:Uncharacterized protein n=1 Tax=Lutibacter oricola TaxID=762486 RepID=A0A1H3F431_9FLAO|nr:hypothetical protein [Lutibacter oricola]SDX85098.1 hypothetical protein SAMN05444411_11097 [Lutibacter oricola]